MKPWQGSTISDHDLFFKVIGQLKWFVHFGLSSSLLLKFSTPGVQSFPEDASLKDHGELWQSVTWTYFSRSRGNFNDSSTLACNQLRQPLVNSGCSSFHQRCISIWPWYQWPWPIFQGCRAISMIRLHVLLLVFKIVIHNYQRLQRHLCPMDIFLVFYYSKI